MYTLASHSKANEERAYRVYVTDMMYYNAQNKTLQRRYADVIRKKPDKEDDRSAEEIAEGIIKRHGLTKGEQ